MDVRKLAEASGITPVEMNDYMTDGVPVEHLFEFADAVRREALEEAAKLCHAMYYGIGYDGWVDPADYEDEIRALIDAPPER